MAGGNKGDQLQVKIKGNILSHPVAASALILRGCMVNVKATGFAALASDTISESFAGISEEGNTVAQAVANGTKNVRCRRRGIFKMKLNAAVAAPTLVGSLVYVHTPQSASVDELIGLTGAVSNHVLVGKIVKHGTDAQAIAGTSTADVWVDVMGAQHTVLGDATYNTKTSLAAHTTGAGAELVGVEENLGWGATPTLQDALELMLANGQIAIPITAFTEEDGTILTVTADATMGFKQLTNEEVILQVTDAEIFSVTLGLPSDADGTADMTLSLIIAKNGTDADDATMDLEAFAIATGAAALSSSDAYAGAAKAIANNVNLQVLDFTIANAQLPAAPRTITFNLIPVGTDELYVYGASLKYQKTLA